MVKVNTIPAALCQENRLDVESDSKLVASSSSLLTLLRVIGDVADAAAAGHDTWCAFGRTKNGSSLTFTLVVDGVRETYYYISIRQLAEALNAAL